MNLTHSTSVFSWSKSSLNYEEVINTVVFLTVSSLWPGYRIWTGSGMQPSCPHMCSFVPSRSSNPCLSPKRNNGAPWCRKQTVYDVFTLFELLESGSQSVSTLK